MTVYAEGLACKNFDQEKLYNVRRYAVDIWFILRKGSGVLPAALDQSQKLKYDRVRAVPIDTEGFMDCTCGYVQRY